MISSKIQLRVQTGWELGPQGNVPVYEWFYLDLGPDDRPIKVEFTFDVADIREISTRNSSYSYPFNVPNNKHNRKIFQFIDNLSMTQGFDARKQLRAYYIENEIIVFDGFVEYKEYVIDGKEGTKEFSLVFYGDNDTLFNKANNKTLGDLDLTQYNFIHSTPNIISSWTASVGHPYRYGLVDRGWNWTLQNINGNIEGTASMVELNELTIGVNKKLILDNIFSSNGLSYISEDLNTDDFKNQYLVFNTLPKPVLPVGRFDFEYYENNHSVPTISGGDYRWEYLQFTNETDYSDLYIPLVNIGGGNTASLIKNPLPVPITYDVTIQLKLVFVPEQLGRTLDNPQNFESDNLKIKIGINSGYSGVWDQYLFEEQVYIQDGSTYTLGPSTTLDVNTLYVYKRIVGVLQPNEEFLVYFKHQQFEEFTSVEYSGVISGDFSFVDLFEGATVDFNSLIVKNIKQLDFLSSIVKERNLMVVPVKNQPNRFLIECRDTFYSRGEVKNWTNKLDPNNKLIEKPIVDDKNRNVVFTHKQDKDHYLEKYNTTYNEVYGQYSFDTLNENIKGEKKIETIFSPTCLVDVANSSFFPISSISKDAKEGFNQTQPPKDAVGFNVRQFYYNWLEFTSEFNRFCFNGNTFDHYPYFGNLSNPFTPNDCVDLNFGPPKNVYYANNGVSQNGLFERFWSKTMEELTDQDSRLVTAYIKLDPIDIYNFEFNDKIYIHFEEGGQYYKVNKIIQWNPVTKAPCKVELIKSKYVLVPPKRDVKKPIKGVVIIRDPIGRDNVKVSGLNNTYDKNSSDVYINGQNNKLYEGVDSAFLNGNKLVVGTESNNIFFTGVDIRSGTQSTDLFAMGSNIEFAGGVTNSVAFGDNIYVTQSNSIYLSNDNIFMNGNIIFSGTISGSFSIPIGLQDVLDYNNIDDDTQFSIAPDNNVILGRTNSNISGSSFDSIIFGNNNDIIDSTGAFASGLDNVINFSNATFVYGYQNTATNSVFSGIFGQSNYSSGPWNFIVGQGNKHNLSTAGFISGIGNYITASRYGAILGGIDNGLATSTSSVIIGGHNHLLDDVENSAIIGGFGVIGTQSNTVYLPNLYITGDISINGTSLDLGASFSVIGGTNNYIYGNSTASIIAGGDGNYVSASQYSVILGGQNNHVELGQFDTILGSLESYIYDSEYSNIVASQNSFIEQSIYSSIFGSTDTSISTSTQSSVLSSSNFDSDNLNQSSIISSFNLTGARNLRGTVMIGSQAHNIKDAWTSFIAGGFGSTVYPDLRTPGLEGLERNLFLFGSSFDSIDGYSAGITSIKTAAINYFNVTNAYIQKSTSLELYELSAMDFSSCDSLTATASSNSSINKSTFLDISRVNNSLFSYVNNSIFRNVDNTTLFNCYGIELYDVGYSFISNLNLATLYGVTASTILSPNGFSATGSTSICVLGGDGNTINDASYSQTIGGNGNFLTQSIYSQMIGGFSNNLHGSYNSIIIGGNNNELQTSFQSAIIIGGINNTIGPINGGWSTIVGGDTNTIVGFYANISGGVNNVIGYGTYSNGNYSFIGGGWGNAIYSTQSSPCRESGIVGGFENLISTRWSFIGGGYQNNIKSQATQSCILGGKSNIIQNNVERSIVLGGHDIIATQNDTVYVPNFIPKSDTPSSTVQSSAGTGATVSISGTNIAGSISITAGTGTGTGQILSATFSNSFNYPNGCSVVLFASDSLSASYASLVYATGTTNAWSVFVNSPLSTAQTYTWNYQVIGY